MTPVETRLALLHNGYVPVPACGKQVHIKGWTTKTATNAEEISVQAKQYRDHTNTGVLTRPNPGIDVDITIEPAAVAVEELAREYFEEGGFFLVRIGQAPKRLILLRTDEPFTKLSRVFEAPDGSEQKIEVLCDGQQAIVDGIHPDTGRPYSWHGGTPLTIKREDLPYARRDDLVGFLDKAAGVLVEQFGFRDCQPNGQAPGGGYATGEQHAPADWPALVGNIVARRDLHDSVTRLAASFVGRDIDTSASTNLLQAIYLSGGEPQGEREQDRFNDIPRAVRSAWEKYGHNAGAIEQPQPANLWPWQFYGRQEITAVRSYLVDKLLPETGVGLISGQWGTYKTFAAIDLAAAVITATDFAGFPVARQGAVLFVAMEGQGEVDIRMKAALAHRGYTEPLAPFAWIDTCPRLLDPDAGHQLAGMVNQAAEQIRQEFNLPVVLVIVDTAGKAAGYTKTGDENDAVNGRLVVTAIAEASRESGALFLGVDHFGKAAETGTRGSSAKESDCDAVLALLGEKSMSGEVTKPRLAIRKRRSGANGIEIAFRPKVVQVGDNETTLVIDWLGEAEEGSAASRAEKKDTWSKSLRVLKFALMSTLAERGEDCRPIEGGPIVRAINVDIVRAEFYKSYPAEGDKKAKQQTRKKAFQRAVKDAQAARLIGVRDIGADTFMWFWIEPPMPNGDGPTYSALGCNDAG